MESMKHYTFRDVALVATELDIKDVLIDEVTLTIRQALYNKGYSLEFILDVEKMLLERDKEKVL